MIRSALVLIFIVLSLCSNAQILLLEGRVIDHQSLYPIEKVSVRFDKKTLLAITNKDGRFTISANQAYPIRLTFDCVGYLSLDTLISSGDFLSIDLKTQSIPMNEVIISASKVAERLIQTPVTVERLNDRKLNNGSGFNKYDELQNLKGVNLITSGLNLKQVNTRGFNSTSNPRFLQLVDGVDNQPPGINFVLGNLFGPNDLDIESLELVPGSASALYGPVAFNGVLSILTKDAFSHPGLALLFKTGVNHINEDNSNMRLINEYNLRLAKPFGRRWAFKFSASYLTGTDWYARNYSDVNSLTPVELRGDQNPARNALNIYGDEVTRNLAGIGQVSRTGYRETDLTDHGINTFKLNSGIALNINTATQLNYQLSFGRATAAQTGSTRVELNGFQLWQHRLELKNTRYFLRGYWTKDNTHRTYNMAALAQMINQSWVQNLNGETVSPRLANDEWFKRYQAAFNGQVSGTPGESHQAARAFADIGRLIPGTEPFARERDLIINADQPLGARLVSKSSIYHLDGQYDLSGLFKTLDIIAGFNYRRYDLFSNGTVYDDSRKHLTIDEAGVFVQVSKFFFKEKLKLYGSERIDKNENFKHSLTSRIGATFNVDPENVFRFSFQTGIRNPAPAEQFARNDLGPIVVLGGAPSNLDQYQATQNTYSTNSVDLFNSAVSRDIDLGLTTADAIFKNQGILQRSDVGYISPERITSVEAGFRRIINRKFTLDINYYYSRFHSFIYRVNVIRPDSPISDTETGTSSAAANDVFNGKTRILSIFTNGSDQVSAQGGTIGVGYSTWKDIWVSTGASISDFEIGDANPGKVPPFNTPKYQWHISLERYAEKKKIGWNASFRWQSAFDWSSGMTMNRPLRVKAFSVIDASCMFKLSSINSELKIGGTNLLNRKIYESLGTPAYGATYYVSLKFDSPLH